MLKLFCEYCKSEIIKQIMLKNWFCIVYLKHIIIFVYIKTQLNNCLIPNFQFNGTLPCGIHWSTIEEIKGKLCFSLRRNHLIEGLERAIVSLKSAGCKTIYLDGSFSTSKEMPGDIDVCWETENVDLDLLIRVEPVLWDFSLGRKHQKDKFGCEFFPLDSIAEPPDKTYFDFFQQDKDGNPKGIIGLKIWVMIKNEKQYGVTKNNLKKFKDAIKVISGSSSSKNPLLLKLQIDSVQSQIDIFEEEIKMYEGLKKGVITNVSRGFEDLSCGIIESRIARGYNQKQFAELLNTSEQQVQKYESENYSNISLKRLQEIVVCLEVGVDATFNFTKKNQFTVSDFLIPQGINPDEIQNKIRNRGTTVLMCV